MRAREHGIYFPILASISAAPGNAKLLAAAISRRPSLAFQRAFPKIDIRTIDPREVVAELFKDWRKESESIVLSAENFRANQASRLRELLPSAVPCTVVLFVRRQDRWIDSYFNQLIKINEINDDISTFVNRLCEDGDDELCRPDWFEHFVAWREAFGNCNVVFYDEVASNVFEAFTSAAGLEPAPDLPEIDRAQVSLNIYELAYLLSLESSVSYSDFLRRRAASERASRRLKIIETRSILSDADLAKLRNRFDESNRRFLAELGRRNDRNLLELDKKADSARYCNLNEIYDSKCYARFAKAADSIYSRRKRRDRFKALFRFRST
jgi:hypothetical protein